MTDSDSEPEETREDLFCTLPQSVLNGGPTNLERVIGFHIPDYRWYGLRMLAESIELGDYADRYWKTFMKEGPVSVYLSDSSDENN